MWEIKKDKELLENNFKPVPAGRHRIRIESVEPTRSKEKNLPMFKMTFEVSKESSKLFSYVVFDDTNAEAKDRTIRTLARIADSFGIEAGNVNPELTPLHWIGKVGGAMVKQELYDGKPSAKIAYFLLKEEVAQLPSWDGQTTNIDDSLPF